MKPPRSICQHHGSSLNVVTITRSLRQTYSIIILEQCLTLGVEIGLHAAGNESEGRSIRTRHGWARMIGRIKAAQHALQFDCRKR